MTTPSNLFSMVDLARKRTHETLAGVYFGQIRLAQEHPQDEIMRRAADRAQQKLLALDAKQGSPHRPRKGSVITVTPDGVAHLNMD